MDVNHIDLNLVISSVAGGLLIALAALILQRWSGRVLGVSGITLGLIGHEQGDARWRLAFLGGLPLGALLALAFQPSISDFEMTTSPIVLALAGLLVGYGARLGSGCTSGHGVCGVGRLSVRSMVATGLFIAAGMATVYVVRHLGGR